MKAIMMWMKSLRMGPGEVGLRNSKEDSIFNSCHLRGWRLFSPSPLGFMLFTTKSLLKRSIFDSKSIPSASKGVSGSNEKPKYFP